MIKLCSDIKHILHMPYCNFDTSSQMTLSQILRQNMTAEVVAGDGHAAQEAAATAASLARLGPPLGEDAVDGCEIMRNPLVDRWFIHIYPIIYRVSKVIR